MNSPLVMVDPIQMTNKKSTKTVQKLQKELATLRLAKKNKNKKTARKQTPFRDVGGTLGKAVGSFFGAPHVESIGKWLGSGIGSIFGSGDYTAMGPEPSYNIFAGQIPKFSTTRATNVVSHREYLGDITGAAAFTNTVYPLNPGVSTTFPWLSTIATCYQQYKFHGLIFEFRPLVTDFVTSGAPGVIVLTTNYNTEQRTYGSRQEAENAEYAVSTKPTQGLVHMIECAPSETANKLYDVRSGTVPANADLRLYDYGNTQVITQNNPSQVLGELWVSYCVEFFKPELATVNGIAQLQSLHTGRSGASSASPFGTTQVTYSGLATAVVTPTTITFPTLSVGSSYQITVVIFATTSVTGAIGRTGGASLSLLNGDTASGVIALTTTTTVYTAYLTATSTPIVLTASGFTIVGTATVDITVTDLDSSTLT